jgi:hypothetical protein
MMEMKFSAGEDGHLVERERHVSVTPEAKDSEYRLIDRAERRAERKAFHLQTRRANLGLIRK